jgi:hypothetical protein
LPNIFHQVILSHSSLVQSLTIIIFNYKLSFAAASSLACSSAIAKASTIGASLQAIICGIPEKF